MTHFVAKLVYRIADREKAISKSALMIVFQYFPRSINSAEVRNRNCKSALSLDYNFQQRESESLTIVSSVAISNQAGVESELGDH
jgi:hypothetical protein